MMTNKNTHGVIKSTKFPERRTDYLYRVSLKGLIRNNKGEILVVKEGGRDHWDLPGGGMDHNENIKTSLARELKEEVNLEGDFSYHILSVDEPSYLDIHDFWQIRLLFDLQPKIMKFSAGEDGDEVRFMSPTSLIDPKNKADKYLVDYLKQLNN